LLCIDGLATDIDLQLLVVCRYQLRINVLFIEPHVLTTTSTSIDPMRTKNKQVKATSHHSLPIGRDIGDVTACIDDPTSARLDIDHPWKSLLLLHLPLLLMLLPPIVAALQCVWSRMTCDLCLRNQKNKKPGQWMLDFKRSING